MYTPDVFPSTSKEHKDWLLECLLAAKDAGAKGKVLSTVVENVSYLCHWNVEKWYAMQIHI